MKLRYMVHKHDATRLHYDLRLEWKGVAKSWAIPKKPAIDRTKRLAIQVDDHSREYMNFEGTIPQGEYGAGKVEIWDQGTWAPESITDKKIVAKIQGKKLNGTFTLLHFKNKNWLFFKNK